MASCIGLAFFAGWFAREFYDSFCYLTVFNDVLDHYRDLLNLAHAETVRQILRDDYGIDLKALRARHE